ncbi:MAG: hypothetical protein J0L84_19630 [Verrucomicrobia bacterium]|nr:hypothetical protein [Verrucomicrobiota bacterium]
MTLLHQGRPRYWIPGFDRVHLALPALLGLVLLLLITAPSVPAEARRASPVIPSPRAVTAPVILSPTAGAMLLPGQLSLIEGIAPAGAEVHLFWFNQALGAPTRAGADGRWRFSVQGIPPGVHTLRAAVLDRGRHSFSSPVLFTIQTPPPARSRR